MEAQRFRPADAPRVLHRASFRRGAFASISNEVKAHGSVLFHRKETHPQELRQARERIAGAVPAGNPALVVSRLSAGVHCRRIAQERRPAGRVHVDISDLQPLRQREAGIRRLFAAAARFRRHRVSAARPDLLLRAARQSPPDHHGQGSAEGNGQGSKGAGGLHGRDSAHDRQRLVRDQRHRARHRLAAAPQPRRVLRARPRQNAQLRQALVFGAGHSLPRLVAGLRVRSQGLPLFPGRPAPQDAGDDAAQGNWTLQRGHPQAVFRLRLLSAGEEGLAHGSGARTPARRGREVRPGGQGWQSAGAEGQAHHSPAHP